MIVLDCAPKLLKCFNIDLNFVFGLPLKQALVALSVLNGLRVNELSNVLIDSSSVLVIHDVELLLADEAHQLILRVIHQGID